MSKRCSKCEQEKPSDQFHRNASRSDGLEHRCKECRTEDRKLSYAANQDREKLYREANTEARSAYHRKWRSANREQQREPRRLYQQRWKAANRDAERAIRKRWINNNPQRHALMKHAESIVYKAVKAGRLIRPDICERCGNTTQITAAHSDYARPLEVSWLCRSCHSLWDRAFPKTLPLIQDSSSGRTAGSEPVNGGSTPSS